MDSHSEDLGADKNEDDSFFNNRRTGGELGGGSFHVMTWDLKGKLPNWDLLEKQNLNIMSGYPPDLICFQNLPVTSQDPAAGSFVKSLPGGIRADYYIQGPLVHGRDAFATLVRKEDVYRDPFYAEPVAPTPIFFEGRLIGMKTLLTLADFPKTSISVCNLHFPCGAPSKHIRKLANEKICFMAGLFPDAGDAANPLPVLGVRDCRDFLMMSSRCPAPVANGGRSAFMVLGYGAHYNHNDSLAQARKMQKPSSDRSLDKFADTNDMCDTFCVNNRLYLKPYGSGGLPLGSSESTYIIPSRNRNKRPWTVNAAVAILLTLAIFYAVFIAYTAREELKNFEFITYIVLLYPVFIGTIAWLLFRGHAMARYIILILVAYGYFDALGFINDDFDQGRHHAIYRLTTVHFVRMWAVLLLFLPPSNRWFNKIQEQRKREKEAALHGLGPIIKL